MIRGFAHDQAVGSELGRAGDESRDVPGDISGLTGQAIHTGCIQPPQTGEEITVKGNMRRHRFFGNQVSARGDIVSGAKILNLAEIVFRDFLPDRIPEIVFDAGGFSTRTAIQRQKWEERHQVVAVTLFEIFGEALLPGQASVRHRLEENAHEGRLIGEGRLEPFAQVLAHPLGIVFIGEPGKFMGGILAQEVDIGYFLVEIAVSVSAFVETVPGDNKECVSSGNLRLELAFLD